MTTRLTDEDLREALRLDERASCVGRRQGGAGQTDPSGSRRSTRAADER